MPTPEVVELYTAEQVMSAIAAAVAVEREACAQLVENDDAHGSLTLADKIRARD